jgi:hypothetical protein
MKITVQELELIQLALDTASNFYEAASITSEAKEDKSYLDKQVKANKLRTLWNKVSDK